MEIYESISYYFIGGFFQVPLEKYILVSCIYLFIYFRNFIKLDPETQSVFFFFRKNKQNMIRVIHLHIPIQ